jgi:hypothetical protein
MKSRRIKLYGKLESKGAGYSISRYNATRKERAALLHEINFCHETSDEDRGLREEERPIPGCSSAPSQNLPH